jgi:hypothetical protein
LEIHGSCRALPVRTFSFLGALVLKTLQARLGQRAPPGSISSAKSSDAAHRSLRGPRRSCESCGDPAPAFACHPDFPFS